MSMNPWPLMLNPIAFFSPVCLHFSASSIAQQTLYADSGAGRNPSVLMKIKAFSKTCFSSAG